MLKLIRAWLRAGVLKDGVVLDTVSGTPQGSPISPLLFNIALHLFDEEWEKKGKGLGKLIRYADLCRHPHKSAYAEDRIMPRKAWKPTGQAELVSKCSA